MERILSAEVLNPCDASSSLRIELMSNLVSGENIPSVPDGRNSVRLFTVLNRKSYRSRRKASIRSFFDCLPVTDPLPELSPFSITFCHAGVS